MASVLPFESTESGILSRLFEAEPDRLPPEVARFLLRLNFSPSDRERMDELAEKARDDALTEAERVELENYCRAGDLVSLMHSRARISLSRSLQD